METIIDITEMLQGGQAISAGDYFYYTGLQQGVVYLDVEIDDDTNAYVIYPLMQMDKDPDIKEVTLYINSTGGDPYVAMSIVDTLEKMKTPVHIHILGMAASAAGFVAMAKGDHIRTTCHPYSIGLIHPGSIRIVGNRAEADDTHDFVKRYDEEIVKKFILSHTNMTEEKYEAIERREHWMLAEEMLELGIVDEII